MRLHLAKVLALAGLLLAGIGASAALAASGDNGNGPQTTVPGSPGDDCSHGNNGKDCRPDPNQNGQDCDDHGNARGNEDHCQASTPSTTTPTTTTTTQTTTTTTQTTTTPTTTTPTTTTPTTSNPTTSSTTTQTTTTTPSTSTTTTTPTTSTTPTGSTTTTATSTPGTTATPPTSGGPASVATPPSKAELQQELAKQAKGVRRTGSYVRSNPKELPFTGFPAWLLAAIGSALLAAGLALRKAANYASASKDAQVRH